MNETLPSADAQKRRSTRIAQAVPITVAGVDALGQPFKERTTTVTVNCHGCKYQSKHYVPKNSVVTLEIPRMEPAFPPRVVQGHVVWVQRPRTVRELFQIGLEFEVAGNVWGIAFPPEDWFPCPGEPKTEQRTEAKVEAAVVVTEEIEMDVEVETAEPAPPNAAPPASPAAASRAAAPPIPPAPVPAGSGASPAGGAHPPASGETKIHVMPAPPTAASADAQAAIARQMAQVVAEAKESLDKTLRRGAQTAINEEMSVLRQQIDAQMHETIERAIKASMERISETEVKKLVQQVANKAAAIVEEARVASEAQLAQIDARVRESVQQATAAAAEQTDHRTASQVAGAIEELKRAAEAQLQATEERTRKVAQDAMKQASAITDQARQAAEADFRNAEEKIRKTSEDAARLAANRAIQQTVTQDLKRSVEEVLQRVIAERQAKMPSLEVLSSPEAAQAHLDGWKKKLEQSADEVHKRTLAHLQGEEQRTTQLWRERFEATTEESSARASEKLSEVSQATLANTGKQIEDRTAALQMLLNQMISQAEGSLHSLGMGLVQERNRAEQTKASLEETSRDAVEQTQYKLDEIAAAQQERIGKRIEELIGERIQSIDPLLRNAAQNVMERFSGEVERNIAARVEEAHQTIAGITDAGTRAADAHTRLNERIQEATAQAAQIQGSIEASVQQVSDASVQKAVAELTGAQQQIARLQDELRQQAQQVSDQLTQSKDGALASVQQVSSGAVQKAVAELTSAQQEITRLQDELRQQAQQVSDQLTQTKDTALASVQQASSEVVHTALAKLGLAKQDAEQLQESIRGQIEQASAQVTLVQHAAREKVQRESDAAVQKAVAELAFAGQEVVRLQDSVRAQKDAVSGLVEEAGRAVREKIQQATAEMVQGAVSQLQNEVVHVTQSQNSLREQSQQFESQFVELQERVRQQVRAAAEQEARESIERARQESAKLPGELEAACRASIARMEEELDQKSSEMQHSAYEALLKTSEWYQKKAQTSMQSTMERVVEQSSNAMKDKAGEITNMVAAELDHYRRSYLEHGQMEFEEAAKEVLGRERLRLNEAAEIASATFTDRTQHVMQEALRRFQETSHEAIHKAQADMKHGGETSLHAFQKSIDEKMTQGVEHAATYLQSQLIPLIESWEDKRQAEQREWMDELRQTAEDSIAAYKSRLENTTNGWLLASAATLGQNSQAVLDSLAKAAEKQLRDTCSRVLAGMADILKDRLMGISTAFVEEKPDQKS